MTSEFRVQAHFTCVMVGFVATMCFVVAFCAGMDRTALTFAAIVAVALGGAVWAHHLEAEADRRAREQQSAQEVAR